MKVLVATKKGQGQRANDFSWTQDGELLMLGFECDRETVDGRCGCRRSFVGMQSAKATTTAMVIQMAIVPDRLKRLVGTSLIASGWAKGFDDKIVKEGLKDVRRLYRAIANWPVGTVVERRGERVQQRRV